MTITPRIHAEMSFDYFSTISYLRAVMEALYRFCVAVAGSALVLISAVIPWGVFTRYVLNSAASWPEPAAVLLTIVATVCVHDSLRVLTAGWTWPPLHLRRAKLALGALAIGAYLLSVSSAVQSYRRLVSLDLPGTSGLHIDREERANYRWVLQKIDQSCDSFVSFPAMHSLYLWTGKLPPVYPEVDGWQPYLSRERQAVERRMLEGPRSCVVYIDHLVPFWLPPKNTAHLTLLGFIQDNFVEVDVRNDFHFLVRK